ncbi:hypothetical protein Poli38472_011512 [Pythium oligandrum]|uniref:Uncharacterized protein n=1 Tax=Pythium oligandrum TaxID=41045 RepID=A0A8K1CLR0_PYTOL|nr:hypothetical protein Poli38472_011512 [Pythium oligandrum]|eukprot:TMW64632.1 hypothetical protein Poli38472_011512 [Pythium oligandrum]
MPSKERSLEARHQQARREDIMSGKEALLVNPEDWTPKQLHQWLRRFEKGRFQSFIPQLRQYSGYDVAHFTSAQWNALTPRDLATTLRFTLLGMVQVAGQDESSDYLTIVTEFTPRGEGSPRKRTLSDSPPRRKAVQFPPVLEFPSIPVLAVIIIFVTATVMCFTVLEDPLAHIGVSKHQLLKYGSIPIVSVVFTYIHIWMALYMTFYPLTYVGCLQIPRTNTGLGWQGIVPHKAEKMARQAVRIMTTQLMRVKEVFARIDPSRVVEELEPILFGTIRDIIEEMAQKYNSELWEVLPEAVKEEIVEKAKEEAPGHIEGLMDEIRNNIEDVFDLEDMVVTNFCRDKQLLVNMFITCGYQELAFIRNSGAWMGFLFGLAQMGLWFFYSNRIVVFPIVGLVVGLITNWLALKMIFEPIEPKRFCCLTLHGLFLRRQNEVAEVYGRLVSSEVLTSRKLFEAILKGPYSDRLFELVYDNVQLAVNEATAATAKIANLGLGEEIYANIKQDVTDHIVNKFPESLRQIEDYADSAMDLETTLREKMKLLSSAQFEQLLHPIFQEDEWKLVLMGGVLGFAIGILQAFFINH